MMKSPLSFALSDKLEKTKASLEYLSSEIEQLNDPGSFLALHGHIREILEKSVISEHFDSESIGDEISAIRAAISLSIVDEYDREMDSVSSSLIKIKAASGLAIANLDVLLLILSKFGVRPRDVNFSSVLGQYVSSRGISTSLIEINERLNSIDELLATAVMDEAKKDVTATKIQWRMFSHFAENTARKIAVAKSNIDTGELVDVVALLRIVEQILRSAKGFFEGARQMVKSVTSSARDVAAKIWNRSKALGQAAKVFVERLTAETTDSAGSGSEENTKFLLSWNTTKTILSPSSDPISWKKLLSQDLSSSELSLINSYELMYLVAASSLPVVPGGIWPNVIRYARYRVETISAERIGIDTARRLYFASTISFSEAISNQRCILFNSTKPEGLSYEGGSWLSGNLGVAVNATSDDREDEVYDVAVALDNCGASVKRLDIQKLEEELNFFLAITEISPERKIMALVLLYVSKKVHKLVIAGATRVKPIVAPALLYSMVKSSILNVSEKHTEFDRILTDFQNETVSVIGYVVGLWINDGLVAGNVHQFRSAFEREWEFLKGSSSIS